jgi:hypothetical protein
MAIAWDTDHLAPIYGALGVDAELTIGSVTFDVTVVDKTAFAHLFAEKHGLKSIKHLAAIRVTELTDNSIDRIDLDGEVLTMGDVGFKIRGTYAETTPSGEAQGELYMVLIEQS